MIFMTSNLGASEMGSILRPNLGFATSEVERRRAVGETDSAMDAKITRAGLEAARRKFTPEFMNRIDKVVVFRSLGSDELGRILTLELNLLQQRIFNSANTAAFVFNVTPDARAFLLREGTDMKYGARHLKRAIERSLVHPLSNLIASDQVHGGDLIRVDVDEQAGHLVFVKEAEQIATYAMVQMIEAAMPAMHSAAFSTSAAPSEPIRVANAKSQRTR
jgi:ATP-dependent Clp protease ATP-binding subunit ClpA